MRRLQDELIEFTRRFMAELPADVRALAQEGLAELRSGNLLTNAIQAGQLAPDFCLNDQQGQPVNLYEALAHGPVILDFFRGEWCPYCKLELNAYQQLLPRIHQLGGSLLAISPQSGDQLARLGQDQHLTFPLLSDTWAEVAKRYGIAFDLPQTLRDFLGSLDIDLPAINGEANWTLPVPATYLLAPDGKVVLAHLDVDYSKRFKPFDALLAMKQLGSAH
jgi:peroxiredoxin